MNPSSSSSTDHDAEATPKRIYLLEDHPTMRSGIKHLLEEDGACCIVGESAQAAEALESVPTLRPDLVIADLVLEGQSGLDFLKLSLQSMPELSVLVYSMHEEKYYAERVLTAGGRGYLMKSSQPETLVHAVRQVLEGQVYLSPSMSGQLLDRLSRSPSKSNVPLSPIERLTDRELEILTWIGRAKTSMEISKLLNISVKTVETHRSHMRQKLMLRSRHELMQLAIRWVEHAV
ncbi:MAG: response regulator transcription factor [Verrucomicrobiota bacterium]|nr:response regulator transcription factor [Verrucomicrobiota bacterium]